MGLFNKKKTEYPKIPEGCEPVLRCSICTGEQTLCARDRNTHELHELMLVASPADLEGFCSANGLSAAEIKKIY